MKKVSKKTQLEPIHIISIVLCLLIAIVFFVLKRKLSVLNSQERNPQENNFLLEAEERRKARIAEEQRKKREEEEEKIRQERQERENKLNSENELNGNKPFVELNDENNIYDKKFDNLDSNYFNRYANNSNSFKINESEKMIDDKKDNMSFKNSLNMSLNSTVIANNYDGFGQNPQIVMKKIVLLDPEVKKKKEESSMKSHEISNNSINKDFRSKKEKSIHNDTISARGIIFKDPRGQQRNSNNTLNTKNTNNKNDIQNMSVNSSKLTGKQDVNKAVGGELIKDDKENSKTLKALHLNQIEKDTFLSVLGLLHANLNFTRTSKIISIESLYEIKLSIENKIEKDDENFNKEFSFYLLEIRNHEDLARVIEKYSESLKMKIIISRKNYSELIIRCLRFQEVNHAIFFICEMDIRNYKIPRLLLQECFKHEYVIRFFKNQLMNSNKNLNLKKEKYSESIYTQNPLASTVDLNGITNNQNYSINLILPENTSFKKNPDYFFFSTKKENYRNESVDNMLNSLDINIDKLKDFDLNILKNKNVIVSIEQTDSIDLNKNNIFEFFKTLVVVNTNKNAKPNIINENKSTKKDQNQFKKADDEQILNEEVKKKKNKKKKTQSKMDDSSKLSESITKPKAINLGMIEPQTKNYNIPNNSIQEGNLEFPVINESKKISNNNHNLYKNIDTKNSYYNKLIQNEYNNSYNHNANKNNYNQDYHKESHYTKSYNYNRNKDSENYSNGIQDIQPDNLHYNPLSKIRKMNIQEVKEFVPKNFVILNKYQKN